MVMSCYRHRRKINPKKNLQRRCVPTLLHRFSMRDGTTHSFVCEKWIKKKALRNMQRIVFENKTCQLAILSIKLSHNKSERRTTHTPKKRNQERNGRTRAAVAAKATAERLMADHHKASIIPYPHKHVHQLITRFQLTARTPIARLNARNSSTK